MYKLYAENRKIGNWSVIATHTNLKIIQQKADKLNSKEYYSYIIKETTKEGDKLVKQQVLNQECKIEYTDEVKVDFEVNAYTFKPSKMKQKEELRKLTQDYIDR